MRERTVSSVTRDHGLGYKLEYGWQSPSSKQSFNSLNVLMKKTTERLHAKKITKTGSWDQGRRART